MSQLRNRLIKLAYKRPELRRRLLPLVKEGGSPQGQWEAVYGTPLDNFTRRKAVTMINKIMARFTKGYFKDSSWKPVNDIRKAMERLKMPFHLYVKNGGYRKDMQGNLVSKEWKIEVPFINNKNRPTCLFGVIICSGAGSVDDPLGVYDVVAYVN